MATTRPRRTAICLVLSLTVFLGLPSANGQPLPGKPFRVGYLASSSEVINESFLQGLRDLGWTPGRNVVFEVRSADGKLDRLPALAAELARLKVDVIHASSPPLVRAAMQATTTIPIVFYAVADPVGSGFVSSLARPGGNVTGVSSSVPEGFEGKLLEL